MASIRQFGMYPRFFVKKKDLLYPIIEKYTGSSVADKKQGQIIKIYFNLLRTNTAFRDEVDAVIQAQGSKLMTVREKIMAKVQNKEQKGNQAIVQNQLNKGTMAGKPVSNFINATAVVTTDLQESDEAAFIQAVASEESQDKMNKGLTIIGIALAGYLIYKFVIKKK